MNQALYKGDLLQELDRPERKCMSDFDYPTGNMYWELLSDIFRDDYGNTQDRD